MSQCSTILAENHILQQKVVFFHFYRFLLKNSVSNREPCKIILLSPTTLSKIQQTMEKKRLLIMPVLPPKSPSLDVRWLYLQSSLINTIKSEKTRKKDQLSLPFTTNRHSVQRAMLPSQSLTCCCTQVIWDSRQYPQSTTSASFAMLTEAMQMAARFVFSCHIWDKFSMI